jgi:hypothetical protein
MVNDWIRENQGKHFCQCGCNEVIEIKRHHHGRGIPKIKKGHQNKGENNGQWNGGFSIDIRGYRLIRMPDHPHCQQPNGYILEHRLVAERMIGRYLKDNEEVHHKDEDRLNNSPSNLLIFTKSNHRKLHNLLRKAICK